MGVKLLFSSSSLTRLSLKPKYEIKDIWRLFDTNKP